VLAIFDAVETTLVVAPGDAADPMRRIAGDAGNQFGGRSTGQQPQEVPATTLHRILRAPGVSFQFLDGQMRFQRDTLCHVSVVQRCDATRYQMARDVYAAPVVHRGLSDRAGQLSGTLVCERGQAAECGKRDLSGGPPPRHLRRCDGAKGCYGACAAVTRSSPHYACCACVYPRRPRGLEATAVGAESPAGSESRRR
jgi:hypothetical protein